MYVLITYDVCTITTSGAKRLRNVARICKNYGQRVQNSVFECLVDASQFVSLKQELLRIIDPDEDCLRIYQLGKISERTSNVLAERLPMKLKVH